MEKDIDWEKIVRLLEEENPSIESLNEQEEQVFWETKGIWQDSYKLLNNSDLSLDKIARAKAEMWERIELEQHQLLLSDEDEDYSLHPKNKRLWPLLAIAASVAILIGIFLVSPQIIDPQQRFTTQVSGEHTLPDQTEIALSSGTVSYSLDEKQSIRRVNLEGSAFFKVAKNKEYPFIIYTESGTTKVVGTAFKLHSQAPESAPILQVDEGTVAYTPNSGLNHPIYLREKEELYFLPAKNAWKRQNTSTNSQIIWSENTVSFDITLTELAQLVSDAQSAEVVIQHKALGALHVSTSGQGVDYQDYKEMLTQALLPLAHTLTIEFEEDTWTIKKQ